MKYISLVINELIARDGNICQLCKQTFSYENPPVASHIQSISSGGLHLLKNMQLLHDECSFGIFTNKNEEVIEKFLQSRIREARELKIKGHTIDEICAIMKKSQRSVYRYLSAP